MQLFISVCLSVESGEECYCVTSRLLEFGCCSITQSSGICDFVFVFFELPSHTGILCTQAVPPEIMGAQVYECVSFLEAVFYASTAQVP